MEPRGRIGRARPRAASRLLVAVLATAMLLGGCVASGRTSHPDNFAGETACPVDPDPSITTTARIGWQAIPNGDLIVKDLQLLEACMPEATITWSAMNSGGDVIQAFGSGSLDISQVGSSPAVKAASPPLSSDLRVLWINDVIGGAESLVARDAQVTDLEGLVGGTIATPFGSTAHYSLLTALGEAGLADEVEVISLTPDAILAAWQRGEIDAAWIWEPTLTELLEEGHVILSSEDTAQMGAPTFDMVAATAQFVQDEPEFVRMWTIAQQEGTRLLREEPQTAATSMAVQLGVEPEAAAALMDGYVYPTAQEQAGEEYFGGPLAQNLADTAGFLAGQREVDAVADDEVYQRMPYPDALQEVAG